MSSVTFEELESIKESRHKEADVKAAARKLSNLFIKHKGKYRLVPANDAARAERMKLHLPDTPDGMIITCAMITLYRYRLMNQEDEYEFVTDDTCCALLAEAVGLNVVHCPEMKIIEEYKGYVELEPTEEELCTLYGSPDQNVFSLDTNQYAILRDRDGEMQDVIKWDGTANTRVASKGFKSRALGAIKSKDEYQLCAFEALQNNDVVALCGRSGTGKTIIPLAYLMQGLETQKIRKLHIIGHFEPLKGSRQLGFMKGDRLQKQMTTGSLGGILESKFSDLSVIDGLLASGSLNIVSTSDLRGVEFGSEDAVFVTEAQDIDAYTIRTIIQRCKEGCKQIYEGDVRQIDINKESGFPKMIEVFKGNPDFACVKLKKDYRSPLGVLADKIV